MREVMLAVAVSATCLLSSTAFSQDAAPDVSNAAPAQTAAVPPSSSVAKQVKPLLARAYRLRAAKKNAESLAAFKRVLAVDPQNHAALMEAGYVYAGLKQWGSALKYLSQASAQDQSNLRLHMDIGYARQALKQYEDAGAEFKVVAQQPGEFQDQAQKALDSLKGAASPETAADARHRRQLEQGYAALKRGDSAAARVKFESAVAADPKDAAALKQLGFINLQDGRQNEAAANFEAARSIEPDDLFIALQLGYVYQRLQKGDEARGAFNAALASVDPKIHDAAAAALKPATQTAAGPAPASPL